jgi:hypothetical protein
MIVERNKKEIVVRLSPETDTSDLQDMLDYLEYKELVSKSKAKQSDIDQLSHEVNKSMWDKIKKEKGF